MSGRRKSIRVLLAEDDDDLRALLACGLRSRGFEVREIGNGAALRDHLSAPPSSARFTPNIIISDLRMPGFTGLEALGSLRRTLDTPFILMSGRADAKVRAEVLASGAAVVLDKPFDLAHLLGAVNALMRRPERRTRSSKTRRPR